MEQAAGEYLVQDLLGAFVTFKPMSLSPNDISSPIGKGGGVRSCIQKPLGAGVNTLYIIVLFYSIELLLPIKKKKKKPTGCRCELTNKNVFYILVIDQEKIGLLVQDSGNLETWGFKRIQRPFALFV